MCFAGEAARDRPTCTKTCKLPLSVPPEICRQPLRHYSAPMRNILAISAVIAAFGLAGTACKQEPAPAPAPTAAAPARRRRSEAAAADRLQRLAGLDGVRGRHPEGLVQGGRRRRRVRLVRIRAVDGGVRRRQGRRGHDDQRATRWSPARPARSSVAILITDYSNGNDMIVAKPGIRQPQGAQGQEGRPRGRLRRAPDAAQGAGEGRA